MKYNVGDRVLIKSLDWYNENKDINGNVHCGDKVFDDYMSVFCGNVVTIVGVYPYNAYDILEDMHCRAWTDEMIEGLVEEETKPNIIEQAKTYWDSIKDAWICPEGYIFKDENGNVINATKIVLEKKKMEYPKTYKECCEVLKKSSNIVPEIRMVSPEESLLFSKLIRLKRCRDAYWKIAGEELGLDGPWEPDWNNISDKYCICFVSGDVWSKECQTRQCPFAFPTPEMRDAFKENFDPDIEICKEFL